MNMEKETHYVVLNRFSECKESLQILFLTDDKSKAEKFIEDCGKMLHKTSDLTDKYHTDIELPFGDEFGIMECEKNISLFDEFNYVKFTNIWEKWKNK